MFGYQTWWSWYECWVEKLELGYQVSQYPPWVKAVPQDEEQVLSIDLSNELLSHIFTIKPIGRSTKVMTPQTQLNLKYHMTIS